MAAKEEPLEYDPFNRMQFWEALNGQKNAHSGEGRLASKLRTRMQPPVAEAAPGTEAYPQTKSNTYLGGGLGYSGSVEGGSAERRVVFVGATTAPASRFSAL